MFANDESRIKVVEVTHDPLRILKRLDVAGDAGVYYRVEVTHDPLRILKPNGTTRHGWHPRS